MNKEEFWKRTNKLLKEKGFTQEKLSIECGFSPNRINNLTAKKTLPDVFEAYTIAQKLDVSVEYLVTGHNQALTLDLSSLGKAFELFQEMKIKDIDGNDITDLSIKSPSSSQQ